ncbi:MAG TPA: OmpA family protein [Saccharospirillum sp.]|nr:OmpA family protein [Saccharospirillum sp.]
MTVRQRFALVPRVAAISGRARLLALVLGGCLPGAWAADFGTGLTDTIWQQDANRYYCKFYQPIPQYGLAVFFHQAGESLQFYLQATRNQMALGQAALTIEAPDWRSSALTDELGYVQVRDRAIPLRVEPDRARRMMGELANGMAPTFTRQARFGSESIRVQLSPVNFKSYYNDYLACSAGLLPVNFSQVERTVVNYPSGGEVLDAEARATLDDLVTYVEADERILALEVVGHSDNVGTRYDNRRLSERRANRVTDYLVEQGVDPSIILTDYQGDRYPIADNSTAAGRAANRRTTILVVRDSGDAGDPLNGLPDFEER